MIDPKLIGFLGLTIASTAASIFILKRKRGPEVLEDYAREESPRSSPHAPLTFVRDDEVGYTRYFLRQLGLKPKDSAWARKGKVLHTTGYLVSVRWSDGEIGTVHSSNLAKPNTPRWSE